MKRIENKPIRFTAEEGKRDFLTIFQEYLTYLVIFGMDCLYTEKIFKRGAQKKKIKN